MERAVLRVTLCGLLLALVTTLPNKDDWDIYSFHINSTVSSRYATTVITSRVANRMEEAKEIEFHVRIPKNAFISKFRMFIDGQPYDGVVKAKEAAQTQYTHAVSRGQSAGIISSVGRTLEEFKTSVNVAAHKKVTFELTYEELLIRRHGKYELQIHARPMQPVKDFKVDVHIKEKASINFLEIKGGLSADVMANAITKTHVDKQAWVYFYPTEDQQKTCANCGDDGMNGDLVIAYDVNRDSSFGDIKKSGGYFVHHFAPSNLPRIPKNVVFVIDRSGSMHGRKIIQTRIALIHILNDLKEEDQFGIVLFDSRIDHWKRELVQANGENLESAKKFAERIEDRGSTDINRAVLEGSRMLNANPREGSASILILLTDGDPTSGVTNLEEIQSNVRKAIAEKFPLYCLGFGFDVNFEFLEKMSLQNNGVARRIYEDSDADLQLQGFYEEVATPLLTDVTMIYEGGANLTKTNFSHYYNGSEIVVAGQITDNDIETFTPQVVAISRRRKLVFSNTNGTIEPTDPSDSHIQRVWAYLTVKQLLEKELKLSGPEKDEAKKEALELSLKYNFVTPHTSMVVTKPQGETTDVLNKPKEGQVHGQGYGSPQSFPGQVPGLGGSFHPMGQPGRAGPPSSFPSQGGSIYPSMGFHPGHGFGYLTPMMTYEIPITGADIDITLDDYDSSPPIRARVPIVQKKLPRTRPTVIVHRPTQMPNPLVHHRFLLKTESQSPPLCYDIFGIVPLKLLHHPNGEVFVNGELDSSSSGGFRKIFIHNNNDQHVEVDLIGVTVRDGQTSRPHSGPDAIILGSMTVILRDEEIDVAVGDMRMIILIHKKGAEKFFWPVLRQRPSDGNFTGILALKPAEYQELQQTPLTKLKIGENEVPVTRDNAVDYSVAPPPTLNCWLIPSDHVLQLQVDDVFISQL